MCGEFAAIAGIISAGASVGGAVARSVEESAAQKAQENALKLQGAQEKSQASQQGIARDDKMMQVESTIRANASASGMALNSGIFRYLTTQSYNRFAEETNIDNLNLSAEQARIREQIDASQSQLHNEYVSNFFSAAGSVASSIAFGKSLGTKNAAKAGPSMSTDSYVTPSIESSSYFSPQNQYEQYMRNNSPWMS